MFSFSASLFSQKEEGKNMTMPASFVATYDTGRLFEPDAILPDQFYTMFKNSQYREPERRLMVAILEDAVSCLSADLSECNFRQRKQYEEARHWVTTDEDGDWIFSFRNICEVLGMDPSYLRRGLIRQTTTSRVRNSTGMVKTRRPAGNLRAVSPHRKIRIRSNS
jgi:hypothetical protein